MIVVNRYNEQSPNRFKEKKEEPTTNLSWQVELEQEDLYKHTHIHENSHMEYNSNAASKAAAAVAKTTARAAT